MDFTKVKTSLEKEGFKVSCFDTKEDAASYLKDSIAGKTVGFGGSVTLQQMGLYDILSENNTVYWHWLEKTPEIMKSAAFADVYISSVNGLAETGEIINIDGSGNRVAATMYGHEKVYLVAGRNKIAEDFHKAYDRAKNIAAPLNAKRLNMNTPCAVKGDRCYNCSSKDRICTETAVFTFCPMKADYEVVLIDEELGY